ncbi:MAG: EAL domain-containing protein, partial [Gammaproteobacteria bacterium]
MDELTNKVIEMALDELTDLKRKNHEIPLSVNVSADSIRSIDLPEKLSALLKQRDLSSNLIQLEITESVLMGELVTSLDILTRLRMKNFALSIDDFGTGFSSLSLLHKIPFTELKVDKSFVMEMDKDRDARAIVKTCIILAKEL